MKVRYKKTGEEREVCRWNTHGLSEVLTGDDSVPISQLDALIGGVVWMDMHQAFKEGKIINSNDNTEFREPGSDEESKRGYYL